MCCWRRAVDHFIKTFTNDYKGVQPGVSSLEPLTANHCPATYPYANDAPAGANNLPVVAWCARQPLTSPFGDAACPQATTVPLGRDQMARMSSFIKCYHDLETALENGGILPSETQHPTHMLTCRWSSPPSSELLAEHTAYLGSRSQEVSIGGRFGGASGGVMLLLRMSRSDADAFAAGDPLAKAGAYERSEMHEFTTHHNGMASYIAAEQAMSVVHA